MREKFNKKTKGFTFAELLITAGIIAFLLIVLIQQFSVYILLIGANRNLGVATSHAQFVMEDIKNTIMAPGENTSTVETSITDGDWDWNITEIEDEGLTALDVESIDTEANGTNPLDINVTVNWEDVGRGANISLETLITEP